MTHYGLIKVAAAVPAVKVADVDYNAQQMLTLIDDAERQGVEVITFPELSITGYTCQDLFHDSALLQSAERALKDMLLHTRNMDIIAIVGLPVVVNNMLINAAAVIQRGSVLGVVAKTYLPNYAEFYEKRWFASSLELNPTVISLAGCEVTVSREPQLFKTAGNIFFGIEICEDVWAPIPPSNRLSLAGADMVFNLSATDELAGKHDYLMSLLSQQSARTISAYIYSSCGYGESTQDVVYGGNAIVFENGSLLAEGERFSFEPQLTVAQVDIERLRAERLRNTTFMNAQKGIAATIIPALPASKDHPFSMIREVSAHPFIPEAADMAVKCEEILNIQSAGLAKRLSHTHCSKVVIGISGGLDSTLALLVCVQAFDKLHLDRSGILGVTMPGFGTTDRTHDNAITLMKALGVGMREINISASVIQHFKDISHDISVHDVTYENAQARERTQILMDLANEIGGMVVGTGDLSELALGWATYNGDHMSMYGVNAGVPKTLIRYLVSYVAQRSTDKIISDTLRDIVDTPISPELIPADEQGNIKQKTEDLVGPYELHDFFIYYVLRYGFRPAKVYLMAQKAFAGVYSDEVIKHWLNTFYRRFFNQQFKRSCLPDGPKVGSVSLSPRGDWRMPSDACSNLWLSECASL